MSRRHTILLTLTLAACGRPVTPYSPGPADGGPGDAAGAAPELTSYSPGSLAVGQTLTLRGKGFATAKGAEVWLRFYGKYRDSDGKTHAVDLKTRAKVVSSSKLTYRLWPDIVFHPTGDRLGTFEGRVVATNYYPDQTTRASNSMAVTLSITPTLILRRSQPKGAGCPAVVANTLEGEQWTFTVEAVGLRKATKDEPRTFYWGLRAEQWEVKLKNTSVYRSPFPKQGTVIMEGRDSSGRTSTLGAGANSYLVKVGGDLWGVLQLQSLATGTISSNSSNLAATVYVVAVSANKSEARLEIDLTVRFPGEVSYGGKVKLVSQGKPESITDCIPGPKEVITYAHDGAGAQKKRTLTVKYREVCKNLVFPKPAWTCSLDSLKTNNILLAFGLSGWQYSPKPKHNLSGSIPKGHYGMFYRQQLQFHRLGLLTLWNRCGRSVVGADVILTDWAYTAELATGPTCPPTTKLPPAKTF